MFQLCFIISNPVLLILQFQSPFFPENFLTYGRKKSSLTDARSPSLFTDARSPLPLHLWTQEVLTSQLKDARSPYFPTYGRDKSLLSHLRTREVLTSSLTDARISLPPNLDTRSKRPFLFVMSSSLPPDNMR